MRMKAKTKMKIEMKTKQISCLLIVFVCLSSPAWAQMEMEDYLYTGTNFTGFTGLTFIDVDDETIPFYQIELAPNFDFGKIGLGLDLTFLYNPDEGIRAENGEKWDSFGDYLRTIRYVRYGHLRESIYGRYGALDYVTIGYGLLMDGYSNYDRRGLRAQLNQPFGGIDILLNNLAEPELYGTRFYLNPLASTGMMLLHRLQVGATYLIDTNPDPMSGGEENFIAYGLDASLPLIRRSHLFMGLYDQLGFIQASGSNTDTASGNAVGVRIELMKIPFRLEYRVLGENFQPVPFDYTYEHRKRSGQIEPYVGESMKGIYSELRYRLLRKFFFLATYEDYDAEGELGDPRLFASLIADDVMEKLSVRALYTKRGIKDFGDIFDLDEKSALTVNIGYEILSPLELIFVHEFRFRRMDDEDEGYETIYKTSVQLGINVMF